MNTIHNISSIFLEFPCIVNKELEILVLKYIYSGVNRKRFLRLQIQLLPLFCVTISNSRRYLCFMLRILDRNNLFVFLYNLITWLNLSWLDESQLKLWWVGQRFTSHDGRASVTRSSYSEPSNIAEESWIR